MLAFQAFTDEKIAVAENDEDSVNAMINKGLGYCIVSQHSKISLFVEQTGASVRIENGGANWVDPARQDLHAAQHPTRLYVHA
jgi:uncharacterized protein YllA (UPF0747 family)